MNGQVHHLGKEKAGTIVTVSRTPKNQAQADGKPSVTAEYFVHSKLPVVFHAGYTYARFQEIKVETVRALEQTALFSEVRSNSESVGSMAAFLSLGRSFMDDEKVGAFFTLGPDFSEPGERLYIGGSLQLFKRFFVTGGLASVKTEEGVNPILTQIGNTLQTRLAVYRGLHPPRLEEGVLRGVFQSVLSIDWRVRKGVIDEPRSSCHDV